MLNVLIIGGSGFLSGTVARSALALGHQVWTLTRGQRPTPVGVHELVADRGDHGAFAQALAGAQTHWDLVVDCIGFAPADIQQDLAVLAPLAQQLVFVSSDFVYDPARRRIPQSEETDAYLTEGYGGQKRRCELELIAAGTGTLPWTIVRPCHIYGPGSQLGCLPLHGRDPQLIARLRAGEPLQLVGGGHFLQQPVLAADLAQTILNMAGQRATYGEIFCVAGPEIVESRTYYHLIANILGVALEIVEVPVGPYLHAHPEAAPFLCHRVYELDKLHRSGVSMPQTSLEEGLRSHVASLLG
ncbi:MAG: NAD-dependent epimerase/dehydratase family protein [Chloroflexales bacterium]|nr:NAD-dependent epimerase/dehydratase family protein [Chloroflexales bacterium]